MYVSARIAYIGVYALGLMPVLISHTPRLLTEPLCVFLISGFAYHLLRIYRSDARWRWHILAAAAYIAYSRRDLYI